MDHSVCNLKAILAVAVLAMAAFAGVMIVGDDADAAEGEYTITYSYNGFTTQDVTEGGKVAVKDFSTALPSAKEPDGYKFVYWVSGSAVFNKDSADNKTTFMGDATLSPVFEADENVVKLIYGDKSMEVAGGFKEDGTTLEDATVTYDKLKKFADAIGAKIVDKTDKTVVTTDAGLANATLSMDGFEFKGFFQKDSEDAVPVSDLKRTGASAGVSTFTAVFEPVFNISFIVEGASVLETTSDKIAITGQVASGDIPKAPSKANYLFMGWYNAAGEPVFTYSADLGKYSVPTEDFKITEGTTLYAKFVPVTFTVTFVYGEEKAVFTTETVKYGECAIEPKGLPEGYKGWDWNFGTKIIADTEIVAIVADPVTVYTVTFEIDGKAPVTQRSDSMVLPDTKIEGKVFQGWVVKGESQYVSPMSYDITEDITFVAVYKEADPPAGPGFFETTTGQCVAVIIAVVIIALVYAVATNMFGLKDALTSVKITRVKK